MAKYFGTDGFRGEANSNLTADHAYQVGTQRSTVNGPTPPRRAGL